MHLARVEVGVAGIQQPALLAFHGNAAVTQRVAREGDEQDLGRKPVQLADGLKPVPGLAGA